MIEIPECLLLHNTTPDLPNKCITVLLALRNSIKVGRTNSLTSLATSADMIVWLAPVSGIQLMSKP